SPHRVFSCLLCLTPFFAFMPTPFFFFLMPPHPPRSTLFPYTTLFRSLPRDRVRAGPRQGAGDRGGLRAAAGDPAAVVPAAARRRSEEHTSELQSHLNLVCRLLLAKKKKYKQQLQLQVTTQHTDQHAHR